MKIRLQDYSLVSNEWIEEKIKHLKWSLDHIPKSYIPKHQAQIYVLSELQQELIPVEKLARVCWEASKNEPPGLGIYDEKEEFLNSKIHI